MSKVGHDTRSRIRLNAGPMLSTGLVCMILAMTGCTQQDRSAARELPSSKHGEPVRFGQCVQVATPDKLKACAALQDIAAIDRCHAEYRRSAHELPACSEMYAWDIPADYYESYNGGELTGRMVLLMSFPSLSPKPRPDDFRDEVIIGPEYWPEPAAPDVLLFNHSPATFKVPTGEVARGMRVFVNRPHLPAGFAFEPVSHPMYVIDCDTADRHYASGQAFLDASPDPTFCQVKQRLGDDMYATYWLSHDLLGQVDLISARMKRLIEGFHRESHL